MIVRICVLYITIIIKSELWIISHNFWQCHEAIICVACLAMFLFHTICPLDLQSFFIISFFSYRWYQGICHTKSPQICFEIFRASKLIWSAPFIRHVLLKATLNFCLTSSVFCCLMVWLHQDSKHYISEKMFMEYVGVRGSWGASITWEKHI